MQYVIYTPFLKLEVFGRDGNGGHMLKIITNLTDDEIARLKFSRRLNWHWRGSRKLSAGHETITDAELHDRGIKWENEEYIEY